MLKTIGGDTMEQTKRDTKKLETILGNVEEATSSFTEKLKKSIKENTTEDKEVRENIKILAHLVTTISKLDNIINKKEPSLKVSNTYINNDPNLV